MSELIYKHDAMDALRRVVRLVYAFGYDNALNEIEALPPVQQWIPVSERLPDEEGRYLVVYDASGIKDMEVDEFLHCADGSPLWLYSQNVIAWMPLPEYKSVGVPNLLTMRFIINIVRTAEGR